MRRAILILIGITAYVACVCAFLSWNSRMLQQRYTGRSQRVTEAEVNELHERLDRGEPVYMCFWQIGSDGKFHRRMDVPCRLIGNGSAQANRDSVLTDLITTK
jgi:hypothetical protein